MMHLCSVLACNCDPEGSLDLQCNNNGGCPCKVGVVGSRCDMCQENKYNLVAGCIGMFIFIVIKFDWMAR